jgi:hypothetical protein
MLARRHEPVRHTALEPKNGHATRSPVTTVLHQIANDYCFRHQITRDHSPVNLPLTPVISATLLPQASMSSGRTRTPPSLTASSRPQTAMVQVTGTSFR